MPVMAPLDIPITDPTARLLKRIVDLENRLRDLERNQRSVQVTAFSDSIASAGYTYPYKGGVLWVVLGGIITNTSVAGNAGITAWVNQFGTNIQIAQSLVAATAAGQRLALNMNAIDMSPYVTQVPSDIIISTALSGSATIGTVTGLIIERPQR